MTAPGDAGDGDASRESADEEGDAGPPPDADPHGHDEEPAAGRAAGDEHASAAERESDEPTTASDPDGAVTGNQPDGPATRSEPDVVLTEYDAFSPEREPHYRQEQTQERPPAVGRFERPEHGEDEGEWTLFARDVVTSVLAVALLGMYLFAISGVWPPMVAIESGSMEPNMEIDDLVFLMETERFQPEEAQPGTGVVTAAAGNETGYGNYGDDGDVIVFEPGGDDQTTPIIHRAMFWVEEGENWCEQADPEYLGGLDTDDDRCIAPNDGFITKGDNNQRYDQASLQAERPIKPEWVVGTAEVRIPRLGWFRLQFQ